MDDAVEDAVPLVLPDGGPGDTWPGDALPDAALPGDAWPDAGVEALGAVWAAWAGRRPVAVPALVAAAARLPEPATIPPRAWLYGTRLIRCFVSVLVAPGGVGKSALAMAQAVAVATGRSFLGEKVHHSVPAWVLNLEDPLDELDRRLAALLLLHAIPREAVRERLFLHSGRERRVCMARPVEGGSVAYPDQAAVIAEAHARGVGLIVVDPFVKSHGLDENSNAHMDAAATAWAEVAEATGAAILLVHHVRKGVAAHPADIEGARGGKALTDAARSAAMLAPMTQVEADELGVSAGERWRHVRLDDAKANMAPRSAGARWFRLETVRLGNGTPAYPHGDQVAAIARWRPATVWQGLSPEGCNRALDAIARGPGGPSSGLSPGLGGGASASGGGLFSATRAGRANGRWAGAVLVERLGLSEGQAAAVIAAWLREGVLQQVEYRCDVQRKTRLGVRVVDARRPTATAGFSGSEGSRR